MSKGISPNLCTKIPNKENKTLGVDFLLKEWKEIKGKTEKESLEEIKYIKKNKKFIIKRKLECFIL